MSLPPEKRLRLPGDTWETTEERARYLIKEGVAKELEDKIALKKG